MSNIVIISGSARCGTLSIAKTLAKSKKIRSVHEHPPKIRLACEKALKGLEVSIDYKVKAIKENSSHFEHYIEVNSRFTPFLYQLYNELNCKIVWLVRDGRDWIRSVYERNIKPFEVCLKYNTRIEKIAYLWKLCCQTAVRQLNWIQSKECFWQKSEKLWNNNKKFSELCRKLELPVKDTELKHLNASESFGLPHWTNWSNETQNKVKPIIDDWLNFFGYKEW